MERSKRANRGQNYARWAEENRLDDQEAAERATKRSKQTENKEEPEIDCPCGRTKAGDGELLECTKCHSHQHKDCINLQEPHVCPKCAEQSGNKSPKLPSNKVRQSVVTALIQVLNKQIIPQAVAAGHFEQPAEDFASNLALEIEAALYAEHAQKGADPGPKYREKFRSLSFNLKDNKNASFQTQVVTGEMAPEALATLSAEEMLNPELRKLADQVKLDSIQSSVLKEDTGPRVRKTHKGEEIVEREGELEAAPRERGGGDSREQSAEPEVQQQQEPQDSAPVHAQAQYDTHTFEEDLQFSPMSPGSDDDFAETMSRPTKPVIWEGSLSLENVGSVECAAVHLGNGQWTKEDWPRVLEFGKEATLKGRVARPVADSYLSKMAEKKLVAAFALEPKPEQESEYAGLVKHYEDRQKIGVLPQHTGLAKDAYLVVVRQGEVPEWLGIREDELDGYFLDEAVLVGVYVLKINR